MTSITLRLPDAYAALIDDGLLTVADLEQAVQTAADGPLYSVLTPAQQLTLLSGSGLSQAGRDAVSRALGSPAAIARDRTARAAAAKVAQLADACTAREAGEIVGRDSTTITRWHRNRALLGFSDNAGALRVPRWQLTPEGPLPGLATVISHRGDLSLTSLSAAMGEPTEELDGATPREWLIGGGDPARVGDMLDGMNSW